MDTDKGGDNTEKKSFEETQREENDRNRIFTVTREKTPLVCTIKAVTYAATRRKGYRTPDIFISSLTQGEAMSLVYQLADILGLILIDDKGNRIILEVE